MNMNMNMKLDIKWNWKNVISRRKWNSGKSKTIPKKL